jgi:putative flippase GtrA
LVTPDTILRFIRYAIVGVATNAAGYLLYLLVTFAGAEPRVAMSVLYVVGATLGYFSNRKWAFGHSGAISRSAMLYVLFHTGGYLINFTLLYVLVDKFGFPHQLVQAFAIAVVASYLFVALNLIVFRQTPSTSDGSVAAKV